MDKTIQSVLGVSDKVPPDLPNGNTGTESCSNNSRKSKRCGERDLSVLSGVNEDSDWSTFFIHQDSNVNIPIRRPVLLRQSQPLRKLFGFVGRHQP